MVKSKDNYRSGYKVKHILLTSNAYYPNVGGIENSLYYLAKSYIELGYSVDVVISDVNSITNQKLPAYEFTDGINIHRYSCYSHLSSWQRPLRSFYSFLAMFKMLKKIALNNKPILTISRFHSTSVLAKLAGLKNVTYLIPGVVRNQNQSKNLVALTGIALIKQKLQLFIHDAIQQLAFRLSDRLFVFSQNMKKQVSECFIKQPKISIVKPGVDIERYSVVTDEVKSIECEALNLPTDKKILLIVGRFVTAKGIMFALEAMKNLPDCHLVLVGGGEEKLIYKSFVQTHNLESSVTFTGVIQNPVPYYRTANVFLMTSTYEPLGQTILEALASGLPVVAFDKSTNVVTATSELLNQNEAIFVQQRSADCLAENLELLFSDDERYQGYVKQSREIAINQFSWSILARTLSD